MVNFVSSHKISSVLSPYFDKVRGNIIPGAYRLQKLVSKWLDQGILNLPCFLVTGSNGKGTTCAYLEQIFRDHKLKTGLYTSPHLVHPNERIRINGASVSECLIEENIKEIEEQATLYLPDATFFEITTATAFLIFLKEKVDFLICEVGLGGHFDSTNALSPLLSIITSISIEHAEYLGNTEKKIASDKSHISRRNKPFIVAPMSKEAFDSIKETTEKIGSYIVLTEQRLNPFFEDIWQVILGQSQNKDFEITTKIALNVKNLRTVLTALNEFTQLINIQFEKQTILAAIKNTFWPGRFDVRSICSRNIIFDAAHNPEGFDFFTQQYNRSEFSKTKCVLLFASLNDKDWKSTLKKLHLIADYVIFTQIDSSRSAVVENFLDSIDEMKKQNCPLPSYEAIHNLNEAIEKSRNTLSHLPLVITGSIAFIGSVMERLDIKVFPIEE